MRILKKIIKYIISIEVILYIGSKKLGNFQKNELEYDILNKEDESRKYIFDYFEMSAKKRKFLDVGGQSGELIHLLKDRGNFNYDENMYKMLKDKFAKSFNYYGVDIKPNGENVLYGDICSLDFIDKYLDKKEFFDIIYSNDTFEHLNKPWVAVENIHKLLKVGGVIVIIVPFSQRYHAVPNDFFRYTHTSIENLFTNCGKYELLKTGYDIQGRRNNWQGSGKNSDIVPVDSFGAWRETWVTFTALKKLGD